MIARKPRVIYNDDSTTLRRIDPPHREEQIALAVDYLKGTHVDCLAWCMMESVARGRSGRAYLYPGAPWKRDTVDETTGGEVSTGYSRQKESARKMEELTASRDIMFTLGEKGIDYLPILIRECRKADLLFAASFRMNDTHVRSDPRGPIASGFWRSHQHCRLWGIAEGHTYYNSALDYSYPEVRELYLSMIKETLEKYDVDGIELDFTRCPYYFQPDLAWEKRKILTDFASEIRGIVDSSNKSKGRQFFLIVRVPFAEKTLVKGGMDVGTWLEKKLPDVLVMSNLFNNPNMNIKSWLEKSHKNGVLFYPSIEMFPDRKNPNHDQMITNPVAPWHAYDPAERPDVIVRKIRAMAQNFLSQKPDGIYTFNYPGILHERAKDRFSDIKSFKLMTEPLSQIASPEALRGTSKQYTYWNECPISIETGRPAEYHQTIRFLLLDPDVLDGSTTVKLSFMEVAERNPHAERVYRQNPIVPAGYVRYCINGKPVSEEYISRTRKSRGRIISGWLLKTHNRVEISVPCGMLVCGENRIAFEIPGFPGEKDPYVYIYEFTADVSTTSKKGKE